MKHGQFAHLMLKGLPVEMLRDLNEWLDVNVTLKKLDQEIVARRHTPPPPRPNKKPKWIIKKKFLTKLSFVPSVELVVNDSISKIRKECYGFRDPISGERIYLRIDTDSVVVFRDSPAGFTLGRRYYVPRLNLMYYPRSFKKVNRLLNRVFTERCIICTGKMVKYFLSSHSRRYRVVNAMIARRIFKLDNNRNCTKYEECLREKTWK